VSEVIGVKLMGFNEELAVRTKTALVFSVALGGGHDGDALFGYAGEDADTRSDAQGLFLAAVGEDVCFGGKPGKLVQGLFIVCGGGTIGCASRQAGGGGELGSEQFGWRSIKK